MKLGGNVLNARRIGLLSSAVLLATMPISASLAQSPNYGAGSDWYWSGAAEAGTNIFLQKPGSGFGRIPTAPFWLTPATTDSNAKMDEYGRIPRGAFLSGLGIVASSKDGRYVADFLAEHVGTDHQRYDLVVSEPGRQYFFVTWDQIPHLLSSSAKTVFGGVGSTRLTVDPTLRQNLENNVVNATANTPAGATARSNIEGFVNNAERNIELKTLREKFAVGYRNTMLDDWDLSADYSHEHRTGTRPLGIGWGLGTAANPRPNTGSIEVPQPLDDRTQNANVAGEYSGTTVWGTRWNTSVQYTGSLYSNSNKFIDVDNPFCLHCKANAGTVLGAPPAGAPQFGPSLLRYGLYPDNSANGLTWNTAVELPIYKTRYTSNMQYMTFRQNDAFLNDATNGLTFGPLATQLNPYPATSLNGVVNAFLANNVLSSHLTKTLTNTVRVRYYDRRDETPILVFTNYAYADGGLATTQPLTRLPHSYSRLNISDDLKWQATKWLALSGGYFFERYAYQNGEVDATNESGARAFIAVTPTSWASWRSSLQYSQRRYNSYLAVDSTDQAANAMRYFFVANRNRTKGQTTSEIALTKYVTISPNGGVRWDEYPTDVWQNLQTLGTQYDRSWNAGSDLAVRLTPRLRLQFSYNHEEHYLRLQSCCGGAPGGFLDSNKWASDITQRYDTFIVAADWQAIPNKLEFRADYLLALATEANFTTFCSSGATNCTGASTGAGGVIVVPPTQFPDEKNNFQRVSMLAKYYLDPSTVTQMGWIGEVALKARYIWERNHNTNWATDNFTPYSPAAGEAADISNGGRSLFLAYNNPNYTAQMIVLSVAGKW